MASASSAQFDPRIHVGVGAERVTHVSSTDYPGVYPDDDHAWDLARFKQRLAVAVKRLSNRSIEFDIVGVDASIANSLRRVLIAEVPSVAIEFVYVWNNTSVMADEVFAHRLGLVPLNVDPALMESKETPSAQATDRNTLVFKLRVACTRKPPPLRRAPPPPDAVFPGADDDELYEHAAVRARDLLWVPQGEQEVVFARAHPAPTNGDIVLVKLRPGQEIELEAHAIKGVGMDHAKFSPVATASYRLLPHIALNPSNPIPPRLADKFASCFAPGVIRVDPRTKAVSVDPRAVRSDTVSREVLRHPEFEGCVQLARVRDHFIFNVETESAYEPQRLPFEAIRIMRHKIATLRAAAAALLAGTGADAEAGGDVQMAGT
ncbi:DNA-directed RNA polymerase [Vararia minispora EC-137]|uniref:DNA-directed RNA polymerase n=1 Tax=Vararia minispora EC-137 TaxID=1314806 RepID=A0ACB8QIE6_9AGAM|nr:DNA-directed RNA polymerase [Vararia minispora EC-137]